MSFKRGDLVFWTDPDEGIGSGFYKIIKTPTMEDDFDEEAADDIFILKNEAGSLVEAFKDEIS